MTDTPFHATATALSVIRHTITHSHDAEELLAGLSDTECQAVGAALLELLELACDNLVEYASKATDRSNAHPDVLIVVAENLRGIYREVTYWRPQEDHSLHGIDAAIVAQIDQGIAHHLIEHPED